VEAYEEMVREVKAAFDAADYPEAIRLIDRHFGGTACSINSLFKDEQRRILNEILSSTHEDLENRFRLITERYTPLMNFLQSLRAPLPPALETAREYVLHQDIRHRFQSDPLDLEQLRNLIQEARTRNGHVLDARISFVVKNRMESLMNQVAGNPSEVDRVIALDELAQLVMPLPLGLNLWQVQNTYWRLLQTTAVETKARAVGGDEAAHKWVERFVALGSTLGFSPKPVASIELATPMAA
jgi:hypothetical protein